MEKPGRTKDTTTSIRPKKRRRRKSERKYILFEEKNGWEKEGWYTFIPISKKYNKQLQLLYAATELSNIHANKVNREKELYYKKVDEEDKKFSLEYGVEYKTLKFWATRFYIHTETTYTREEAQNMIDSNYTSYMSHKILEYPVRWCVEDIRKLEKLQSEGKKSEIYGFLYKGGVRHLLSCVEL